MHLLIRIAPLAAALLLARAGSSRLVAQSAPRVIPGPTPSPALLVLSKAEHVLSIVDPATLTVVAQVPSGPDPHEVVASADGSLAYISNYGGGAFNTISPIDLVKQQPLPVIDLGPLRGPHGLEFVGGKLWFTAEGSKAVGSYDPVSHQVDWALGTGQNRTHMLVVSKDLKRILTTNVSSGTVTVAELSVRQPGRPGQGPGGPPRAEWDETVVKVGNGAEGFDVTPDGKEAWVANAQDGTISVIDLTAKRVTQTIQANVGGANRLKITPDGTLAFVSSLRGPNVTVLRVATRQVVKRVAVGHGAAGIQMQPDGARAYVACTPDNYVAVIDVKTLSVVGHVAAGGRPDGLAWAVRP